jgi:tRNA (guanosine-2'-O-)-methyltransferase
MNKRLIEHLSGFITERRLKLFDSVLDLRTRYMTVVLEDVFQPHNASAVLRSCECFGIQDIHIIENKNPYRINPDVALGSYKWLTIHRYNQEADNTRQAITALKNTGYRIIATSPHKKNRALENFDLHAGKFALLLGTELSGLSPAALDMSDEFIRIPMAGFTESLNISVTAAIAIHHLSGKMRSNNELNWHLNQIEKDEIKLTWLKNSIRKSDLIVKTFQAQQSDENKEV